MQSAPLELSFKHLADGQLGLLRTQMPLDCGGSDPLAFKGSAIAARLNGELVAELCTGAASFVRRPGSERQVGLLWQVTGRCHLAQAGRQILLDAGDWAVFDPEQDHAITVEERARFLILWTARSRVDSAAAGWPALAAVRLASAGPAQIALAALGALLRSGIGLSAQSATTLHDAVLGLVTRALTQAMDAHGLVRKPAVSRERAVTLAQLQAHVTDNLGRKDFGVEQLAEAFGISRRTVYKLFEPLDITPHQFIQNARLDQALRLLGDTAWRSVPIAGIGRQCGFADPAHFSKAFRARTGVAPTVFRETAAA